MPGKCLACTAPLRGVYVCKAKRAPATIASRIAGAIAGKLKVEVPVIVKTAKELAAIGWHAAHLPCSGGILKSKAGEALLGKVGRRATARNLTTTLKLQALAGDGA